MRKKSLTPYGIRLMYNYAVFLVLVFLLLVLLVPDALAACRAVVVALDSSRLIFSICKTIP